MTGRIIRTLLVVLAGIAIYLTGAASSLAQGSGDVEVPIVPPEPSSANIADAASDRLLVEPLSESAERDVRGLIADDPVLVSLVRASPGYEIVGHAYQQDGSNRLLLTLHFAGGVSFRGHLPYLEVVDGVGRPDLLPDRAIGGTCTASAKLADLGDQESRPYPIALEKMTALEVLIDLGSGCVLAAFPSPIQPPGQDIDPRYNTTQLLADTLDGKPLPKIREANND